MWKPDGSFEKDGLFACHREGKDATIITYGTLINNAMAAAEELSCQGIEVTVLRLLTLSALPNLKPAISGPVVLMEEACTGSGIREALAEKLSGTKLSVIDLGSDFVPHGAVNTLYEHYGLDGMSVANFVKEVLGREN